MLAWGLACGQTPTPATPGIRISGRVCAPEQGCGGDSTRFQAVLSGTVTRYQWNFGDVASAPPEANTSARPRPGHLYQQAGRYVVTLIASRAGRADTTLRDTVTINTLPPSFEFFQGKEDTLICPGTKLLLDPYAGQQAPPGVKYLWYPTGDTTRTILADSIGCYSVEVKNAAGCTVTDRINVKICTQNPQQSAKWYFGSNAGIDFKGGSPTPLTNGKLNTLEGSSTISDERGKLLFYTDGVSIYDRDGNPMKTRNPADTARLRGSPRSTQSALIVPQPSCRGCETIYYVFTTTSISDSARCLSYTTVDMRGNRGKGEILEKNIPLHCPSTERLTSVQSSSDSAYWVVSHDYNSNDFRLFKVTKNGVEAAGTQGIGLPHDSRFEGKGQIKLANSGKKLAVVIPGPPRNYVEVYDFSDSLGTISNKITIDLGPAPPSAYGVEFSPDGTKMFVTLTGNPDSSKASRLLQYDLTQMDSLAVANSKLVVDSSATQKYGSLQYAPDGKIYLAIQGSRTLGVINQPDGTTITEIQFERSGFDLGGRLSQLGLPNFVQSIIEPPTSPAIAYTDTCLGTPTKFSSGPICDPLQDKYQWNFGDGATSDQSSPEHLYARAGTYTVTLRQSNQCKDTTMTQRLTIVQTPKVNLGADVVACRPPLTLNSGVTSPNARFFWVKDSLLVGRGPTFTATDSGQYVLLATVESCFDADTVQVRFLRPPKMTLGPDTSLCPGTSLVLTAPAGDTYAWSTGATTRQLTVTQPGSYWVKVKSTIENTQCETADTIVVKRRLQPPVQVQSRAATSCRTPDGQLRATVTLPAGAAVQFVWTRAGSTTPLPATTAGPISTLANVPGGAYQLRVSGAAFCDTLLNLTVGVNTGNSLQFDPPQVTDAYCNGPDSGRVTLRLRRGVPISYRLLNGAVVVRSGPYANTLTGLRAGSYGLEITDTSGCQLSLPITIGLQNTLRVSLGPDRRRCANDTVQLQVLPVAAYASYLWNDQSTAPGLTVSRAGQYSVTVRDAAGCTGSAAVRIGDAPAPQLSVRPEAAFCVSDGTPVMLDAGGNPSFRYLWQPTGDTTRLIRVSRLGTYTVQVTNREGCTAQRQVQVIDRCEAAVYVPEVFTPNGDGINDVLEVFTRHVATQDYEFRVYNRWGEMVFRTTDRSEKWDGRYKGREFPPQSYAWVLVYRSEFSPDGGLETKRGAVLLSR